MLIAEAKRQGKPYGLIIRDITGGNTNTSSFGYQAFKGIPRLVYRVDVRDGKETLVRGVEMVGTPLSSINKIMATGKTAGRLQRLLRRRERQRAGLHRGSGDAAAGDRAAAGGGGEGPAAAASQPGDRARPARPDALSGATQSEAGEAVGASPPPGPGPRLRSNV